MTIRQFVLLRAPWLLCLLLLGGLPIAVAAVTAQGFGTSDKLPAGALVSINNNSATTVALATSNNLTNLAGVVVTPSETKLVSLGNQTLVASSGLAYVLVSNLNGPIERGDYITASQIAGVGTKATASGIMLGTAQADFTGYESGDTKELVKIGSGHQSVAIGQIPVQIGVGPITLESAGAAAFIPVGIQNLADEVAGHAVSALRLLLAGLILVVGLIGAAAILYGAVRNSMLSLGRNPLSSPSVYRGLAQVALIVLMLLAVCLTAMYLVVRL